MSRQRSRDTEPELRLRRALHSSGRRYRVAYPIAGARRRTIDIAFTRAKVAVFVDGCFWHSCPVHGTEPKADSAWWTAKLQRNIERDRETDELLTALGWTVIRVWEHVPTAEALDLVERALQRALGTT